MRLLADDLTGALDSAAQFVPMVGPVPTFWHGVVSAPLPPSAALDSGTRECDVATAAERIAALAPALAGADIAFKKIDSLLRGPTAAEIAACVQAGRFATCIIAPAFPAQGRITRAGRQLVRGDGGWQDTDLDLAASLRSLGISVRLSRAGDPVLPGVSVWDAETDADLERIVAAAGENTVDVLWCGTGGLAGALAGAGATAAPSLERPLLGLFGSDHDVTLRQLQACDPHWLKLSAEPARATAAIRERLDTAGLALVNVALSDGLTRAVAAERIAAMLAAIVRAIPPPRTLVVAGGETLRALCGLLGATSLTVVGQVLPGVPVSLLHGGKWDGVTVVSKSGAFGDAGLLRRLAGLDAEAVE